MLRASKIGFIDVALFIAQQMGTDDHKTISICGIAFHVPYSRFKAPDPVQLGSVATGLFNIKDYYFTSPCQKCIVS
jgi:hypothetical protein